MQHVVTRFGLTAIFAEGRPATVQEEGLAQLGREAALALLQVAERALTLSSVAEENWWLGGPPPPETINVPVDSVAVLAEVDRLLWALPQGTSSELLTWILRNCERILHPEMPSA
jgi:hypothetical protein